MYIVNIPQIINLILHDFLPSNESILLFQTL